ncbi:hypothetical protein [Antarcticimicrobium sediminis]|uniref:Uncharacterized protein n=1 Tax=Antarcticimicrobium sediminis TaxID=2546227 RepID=A0A4R5F0G2_9RHOB|nr:hypothetical protein [Antarcticimicrobium sediminis]TDE40843.1 hypothetical protein E1B25_01090 [Antarcticimicrobium sediminis]
MMHLGQQPDDKDAAVGFVHIPAIQRAEMLRLLQRPLAEGCIAAPTVAPKVRIGRILLKISLRNLQTSEKWEIVPGYAECAQ